MLGDPFYPLPVISLGNWPTDRTPGVTSQAKIMYRPVFVQFRLSKIPVYVVPFRRV